MSRVIYTAIVLDVESQELLKDYVPQAEGWQRYCHHFTLKFGDQEIPDNLGEEVRIELGSIYADDHCVCVEATPLYFTGNVGEYATGKRGHITIACKDVPPKYSNEIVGKQVHKACDQCYCGSRNLTTLRGRVQAFVTKDDGSPAYWI